MTMIGSVKPVRVKLKNAEALCRANRAGIKIRHHPRYSQRQGGIYMPSFMGMLHHKLLYHVAG
jgi:hypothetical protein